MTPADPLFPTKIDPHLKAMPKCNLHSHLEGSLRPRTLWELAELQHIDLGIPSSQLEDTLQVDGSEASLVDYLQKISISYKVLKHPEALHRTAYEAAEDAAKDGVIYFELRAGPVTHSTKQLPTGSVIEYILEGLKQAEADFNITCRLIVSALRDHDPKTNIALAEIAARQQDQGVVGFDLAGDEVGHPASLHHESFKVAREAGLGITVHAGEAGSAENVRYAIEQLGATRIGHGIRSIESEGVLHLLEDQAVLLEICPSSNVHTRSVTNLESHPVRDLFERGLRISIGDDDPITSRTSVSKELTLLQDNFGFTRSEVRGIQRDSVQAGFLQEKTIRAELYQAVSKYDFPDDIQDDA